MLGDFEAHDQIDFWGSLKALVQVDGLEFNRVVNHHGLMIPIPVKAKESCTAKLVACFQPSAPAASNIQDRVGAVIVP